MTASGFKLLDAYVEVHADASRVTSDAESQIRSGSGRLIAAGSGLGSSLMGGLHSVIGGAIGGVVGAITYPLVQGVSQAIGSVLDVAKSAVVDYNVALENANIGFTTMLGSGAKARSFLNDLQAFAAKTPFEFSDLTLASQRLIAMGVHAKDVIPYMTGIGDAVAGLGGDKGTIDQITRAIGQMTAKGKVQGDELMQLNEVGVPALKILADSYGVTTDQMSDMISAGKVLSDRAVPAIIRGLEKGTKSTAGFGGMMAKQSKTMAGSMSNIRDAINQTLSKAFLPLFKVLERTAGQLARFAGSKAVANWARDTAKNVGQFMDTLGKAVRSVFSDPKLQGSISKFGSAFTKAMHDSGPALKEVLPNLVRFAKDVLPAVVDGGTKILKQLPSVMQDLADVSKGLAENGKQWAGVIRWIGDFIAKIAGSLKAIDDWAAGASHAWFKFRDGVNKAVTDAQNVLLALPARFAVMGANAVQGLINGVTSRASDVINMAKNLADQVAGPFFKALQFGSPSKLFHQYGTWVVQGLHKGLLGSVDQIKSASTTLSNAVKDSFDSTDMTKRQETGALTRIKRTTKALIAEAKLRDKAVQTLADARDRLTGLRADKGQYGADVRSSVIGMGAIGSLFQQGGAVQAGATTLNGAAYQPSYSSMATYGLASVKSGLRTLLSNTRAFTANLKTLVKAGLDRTTLQQLVDAGPTDGLPITTALLADRGSLKEIVSLQGQLYRAGTGLGSYTAGQMYDSRIASAQRSVNRDQRVVNHFTVRMVVEAKKIDEVQKMIDTLSKVKSTARARGR